MEMEYILVIILILLEMVVNGGMMGQKCQTQLFGNRCSAWELFWVVSLSSGSTVADLNWAASCVNCELNWIGVASQLNRAHSEQGGDGDHLARPVYHPSSSIRPEREPFYSNPSKCLRNVRRASPGSKGCHTSVYRHNKSRSTSTTLPYWAAPYTIQVFPIKTDPVQPFCGKQLLSPSLEEAHSGVNNAQAIFAPSSVRLIQSR